MIPENMADLPINIPRPILGQILVVEINARQTSAGASQPLAWRLQNREHPMGAVFLNKARRAMEVARRLGPAGVVYTRVYDERGLVDLSAKGDTKHATVSHESLKGDTK